MAAIYPHYDWKYPVRVCVCVCVCVCVMSHPRTVVQHTIINVAASGHTPGIWLTHSRIAVSPQ